MPKPNEIIPAVFKVGFVFVLFYLFWFLGQVILIAFLGAMLAVTVTPALAFMSKKGVPRWLGIFIILATLMTLFAILFSLFFPTLAEQFSQMPEKLPEIRSKLLNFLPAGSNFEKMINNYIKSMREPTEVITPVLFSLKWIGSALWNFGLCMVFATYFLIDGPRAYRWFLDFFATKNQNKLEQTSEEISGVIVAYGFGQLITSLLCGLFTLVTLSLFEVPASFLLASAAALFDILPIVGVFLFAVPAVAMGLTVSATTGLWVAICFAIYHLIESYWIVPFVYGKRLQVSGLAVLSGLIVGDLLAGIPGALAALPILASYPIIERIWLRNILGSSVIQKHEALSD